MSQELYVALMPRYVLLSVKVLQTHRFLEPDSVLFRTHKSKRKVGKENIFKNARCHVS